MADAKRARLEEEEDAGVRRCGQPLYVLTETLECALLKRCISCCHKILAGQHTLLANSKPNCRPELCPRSKQDVKKLKDVIGLIPLEDARILTVGDGDLSFSLALARALSNAKLLVATTYEPKENIAKSYPQTGLANISKLTKLGVKVLHNINAEELDRDMFFDDEEEKDACFDIVIFNFPCVAVDDSPGLDGQLKELELNQRLLERFGATVFDLLTPSTGQVHVTHKTKAAFQHWQVPECITKSSPNLHASGALVFDRCVFPGYVNRKVRDAKSFPMTDAVTFLFTMSDDQKGEELRMMASGETPANFIKRLRAAKAAKALVNQALLLAVNQVLL